MIYTERLILKSMGLEDEKEIVKWRNRPEIMESLFSYKGVILEEHRNWFESYIKNNSRMEFVIVKKSDNKKIGTIGLSNIDHRNQKAEYGIILGEKEEWGKGFAKEASMAIISYGFYELNLQKIYLNVFSDNANAIELYKNINFIKEGILRKDVFKKGEFKDVIVMSLLRDEWKSAND